MQSAPLVEEWTPRPQTHWTVSPTLIVCEEGLKVNEPLGATVTVKVAAPAGSATAAIAAARIPRRRRPGPVKRGEPDPPEIRAAGFSSSFHLRKGAAPQRFSACRAATSRDSS